MGKTSKWLKNFLTGKKEKDKEKEKEKGGINRHSPPPTENSTTPIAITPNTPKEKKRWSFRRSAAAATTTGTTTGTPTKDANSAEATTTPQQVVQATVGSENEEKKHAMAMAMAAATAAAADAAVTAAQAAAAVIRLTAAAKGRSSAIEEAAAIKIQSVFRSFLARKALCALKGLVKLQALVRGHLVRKQATATLRCMQALVTAQARARAQRIGMAGDEAQPISQRQSTHRKSPQNHHFRQPYNEMDRGLDENVKIVEMDLGEMRGPLKARNSYSNHTQAERIVDHRFSTYYSGVRTPSKQDYQHQISPVPSALTDMSPRACSGHFEEYSFDTTQSSPQYYSAVSKADSARVHYGFSRPEYAESVSNDYSFFPNYMANTESSKAKVRSQSAPKQRPENTCERPPSRRRISTEGRNIPRAVRMQRSSSHVGSAVQGYHYPWSMKLDRSTMSLKESECGSTSTVLTNTNYCRSLVAYEVSNH